MEISLNLLIVHFMADFVCQNDWMALNKSKSWAALLAHCAIYALCFVLWGWTFVTITFALHVVVDFITSRITSHLWFMVPSVYGSDPSLWMWKVRTPSTRHWFFVTVGFDQLIHYACLAWTLKILS